MADKKAKFSIVIGAVDEVTMKVMEINQRLQKALDPVKKLNSSFNLLGTEIGAGRFGNAIANVGSKFRNVITEAGKVGLALGAVGAGFGYLIKGTADYADAIKDASDRIGISTQRFQEWRYAAQQSGIDAAEVEGILTKFSKTMGQAAFSGGKEAQMFDALGVSIRNARGEVRSMEDILPEVADAMKGIQNPTLRNTILMELFGKQGAKVASFLNQGSEGLKKMAEEAGSLGAIISQEALDRGATFNDRLDSLLMQFNALKVTTLSELFPILIDLLKQAQTFLKENSGAVKEWAANFAKDLPRILSDIHVLLSGLWKIASALATVFRFLSSVFGEVNTILGVLAATVGRGLVVALWGAAKAVWGLGAALMATPVGWIVAGIAAIAAGAYLIYDNWEPITEFFGNLWQGIKDMFNDGIAYVTDKLKALLSFLPDSVLSKIGFNVSGDAAGGIATGAPIALSNSAVAGSLKSQPQENHLTVTFDNMPKGARVNTDRSDNPMDVIMQGVPMGAF